MTSDPEQVSIYDWAVTANLQPEPITVEVWRNLPEEFCRQVELVNGQVVRCEKPSRAHQAAATRVVAMLGAAAGIPFYWLVWLSDDHVLSIDIHVLDHTLGFYRLFRTLTPEQEVSTVEVPIRIQVDWRRLAHLVRR